MPQTKILLADDDRIIVTTLAEDLVEAGYEIVTANNGRQAVEACLRETPDLAILDIRMPVMDGMEAATEIKAKTNIPYLFLTAYSDKEFVEKAVKDGALGYLVKPVNVEKLVPVIETALARAKDIQDALSSNIHLTKALEIRREIDIALGLLMERHGLKRQESFDVLRRMARADGVKVEALASKMVESADTLAIPQNILQKKP